jgi:hypothetical protein
VLFRLIYAQHTPSTDDGIVNGLQSTTLKELLEPHYDRTELTMILPVMSSMRLTLTNSSRFSKPAGKVMTSLGRPTTTTPSSLQTTRFLLPGKSLRWRTDSTKPSANLAKSKNMHKEMESVLGEKSMKSADATASASASQPTAKVTVQARQRQRSQAYINAGISFFTVILAAQVLKTGMQKRKLTLQTEVLEEILVAKGALLRSLGSDETLLPIANQCAKEILDMKNNTEKSKKASWWGGSTSSSSNQGGDEKEIAERILVTLRAEMQRRIGYEGMTEEEKDKTSLKELQPELDPAEDFFSDENLLKLEKLQDGQESNGETVVKRKVFSI